MKKRISLLLFQAFIFLAAPFVFAKDSATIAADANRLYKAGKYDAALKLYDEALISNPDSPILHFNLGSANFKKGDYEKAVSWFEKAALSGDTQLEAKANYNIGNAKYKLGKRKENTNLSATVKLLGEALDYYKRAIEVNNKGKAAKINYELVERELKALWDKLKQQAHKKEQEHTQEGSEGKPYTQEEENQKEGQDREGQGQKEEKKEEEKEEKARAEKALPESEQAPQAHQAAQGGSALEPQETKEISPEEARMLLEGYRQEEDAKGQIKYIRQGRLGEVDKDW